MILYQRIVGIFLTGVFTGCIHAELLSYLYPTTPDIIVNADVFDPHIALPTPAAPVYYLALVKGYRQFGYEMPGEKRPESKAVLSAVTKILEHEGYKLATSEHAPNLIILYSWGDFNYNYAPFAHTFATEMLEFLGADKVGGRTAAQRNSFPELEQGLTSLNSNSSTMSGFLYHGMYVLTFWAFDYAQAQKGTAKLVWKTNIASSSRGFYLPEVLPTMIAVAAPYLGRETTRPIRIDVAKNYQPRIDLGPLRVLDGDVKLKEQK